MACGDDRQDAGSAETLDEMRARHRAVARYRVCLFAPRHNRQGTKSIVAKHLSFDEARTRTDQLNAELTAAGKDGFMAPLYGLELENYWETLSEAARERHAALGKGIVQAEMKP